MKSTYPFGCGEHSSETCLPALSVKAHCRQHGPKTKSSYSASGSLRQLDHQRRLLPHYKYKLLIGPPFARFAKFHVEMPEHSREDAADFRVRQTKIDLY